jgi:MFS family permease
MGRQAEAGWPLARRFSTCFAVMTEPPLSPTGRSRKAKSWIGTAVGQTVAVVIGISIVGLLILAVKIPIVGFIVGLIVLLVVFIGKGLLGLDRREFWRSKAPPAKSEELKGQSAQSDQPDLARLRRKTFFWVITACVSGVLAYMGNVIPSGSDWMAVPEIALVICIPACFIAWRLWRVYHLALRRVMALQAKPEGLQGQSVQGLQGLQGLSVQSDQPPVLYLRSFDQDQKTAKRKGSWTEGGYTSMTTNGRAL